MEYYERLKQLREDRDLNQTEVAKAIETMERRLNIEKYSFQFCENLHRLRIQENLSLEELARRSGVPLAMLEQLEQNTVPEGMMVGHAIDLARALWCDPGQLFE